MMTLESFVQTGYERLCSCIPAAVKLRPQQQHDLGLAFACALARQTGFRMHDDIEHLPERDQHHLLSACCLVQTPAPYLSGAFTRYVQDALVLS